MISTRKACAEELVCIGREIITTIVLEGDISKSTYSYLFKREFPERFLNMGIAEQNMMGVAAGLSTMGFIPIVMTYAVFASMRACEQLRTSICCPNLNVKLCVSHGGLTPGKDGATHQATEDLSMMRAIPNLTVIMPCDGISTRIVVRKAMEIKGPVYIRLSRNDLPVIYNERPKLEIGKAIILREGLDIAIIANGDMVSKALEAAEVLYEEGINARIIDMHTIKPLDEKIVILCAKEIGAIVTVEDNNILGGMGAAVTETVCENYPVPVIRVGLKDTFAESGIYDELLKKYEMDVNSIVSSAQRSISLKNRGIVNRR